MDLPQCKGGVAKDSVERQAEENRIATAVNGISGNGPVAQRIAAFTLLQRQAVQKLERANESDASDAERRDALNFFRSTLRTLEGYIRDPVGWTRPEPWAVGDTTLPRDVHSVGFDVQQMLEHESLFNDVRGDRGELSRLDRELPQLDLNFTSLYEVDLGEIDTSWLSADDFHGIDLRKARIVNSKWQGTDLHDAYLRCADLSKAHFNARVRTSGKLDRTNLSRADLRNSVLTGADLRDADLEGANLQGARLQGAKLGGVKIAGANFTDATISRRALRALENAEGRDSAVGLPTPPQLPAAPSEAEVAPECAKP